MLLIGGGCFAYAIIDTIRKPVGLDGPAALFGSIVFIVTGLNFVEGRKRSWFRDLGFGGAQTGLPRHKRDAVWLFLILAAWGLILSIKLDTLPGYFQKSEVTIVIYGRKVCAPFPKENRSSPWTNIYNPFLGCVPRFWMHRLFPSRPYFGSRLCGVISAIATLWMIFMVSRAYLGRLSAWLALLLFGTSHMFLIFARYGLTNLDAVFLMMFSLLALLKGLRSRRVSMGLLAGIGAGLGYYTYYAALVIFPTIIALFLLQLVAEWKNTIRRCPVWFALLLGYIIAFAPNFIYNKLHTKTGLMHTKKVMMTAPDNIKWGRKQYGANSTAEMFLRYAWPAIGGVFLWPHNNYWSDYRSGGMPITDRDTTALFLLGLAGAICLWRRRLIFRSLFLCWLVTIILGSLLTRDAPYAPRLVIALSAGYMLAGWVLSLLIKQACRVHGCLWRGILFIAIIVWTLNIATRNIRHYYGDFMDVHKNPMYIFIPVNIMNFLHTFPRDAYLVLYTRGYYDQFGSTYMDLFDTGFSRRTFKVGGVIPPPDPGKDTAYVLNLDVFKDVDQALQKRFPGVKPDELVNPFLPDKMPKYRVYWVRRKSIQ